MSELLTRADDSPTTEPVPERETTPSPAPQPKPEEYPIIEPAGPFRLPRREQPKEPPKKTIPYTPAPVRYIPKPQDPGKREITPFSPHKKPATRRKAA